MSRPFVLLKIATSLDGYIDDNSPQRRIFSSEEDAKQVDLIRADCDVIMVGAQCVRADNPHLLIKDPELVKKRLASGKPAHPTKVTITASGDLSVENNFFQTGEGEKLVYAGSGVAGQLGKELSDVAEVVVLPEGKAIDFLLEDLKKREVEKLLVEGGGMLLEQFLSSGAFDELRLCVAPVELGEEGGGARFDVSLYLESLELLGTEDLGGCAVTEYKNLS